jgi:hypothetical protein
MKLEYSCLIAAISLSLLNGCSVLIGNVKPVEEKAAIGTVTGPPLDDSHWKKINLKASSATAGTGEGDDVPDVAYQSTKTASVIALNSACRRLADDESDAKTVTESILSSWRDMKNVDEANTLTSGFPSLQTTAQGIYLNRRRKFQLVVVKSPKCVYDLIYLSPVTTFDEELADFQRFRDTLKLK